jgi:serine/threonine-protein kinase
MTVLTTQASTWFRLSPWLDELLGLEPAARAARLAALRHEDAALADELAAVLDRLPVLEEAGFLHAPALPAPTGWAGQQVGAYVLERELGQGGMGSVWLARRADGRYSAQVAIKFMRSGLLAAGAADRFLREGQLLARLSHPNIARLLDAGVQPDGNRTPAAGQPYLVLEYIEGQPIDRHCDARGLDTTARVRLMLDVLAAVAHAHSRLILHRDLKPSNILVTPEGSPKLLDFGIGKWLAEAQADFEPGAAPAGAAAAITQFTELAFTARYAAPEQVLWQEVTTATDVYTLGVLLYELLGGGHPTEAAAGTRLAQLQAVAETVPARLSDAVRRRGGAAAARSARALRGDLDTIVARALKKQPAERYPHAAALADDLRRWLDHEPVQARPDRPGYRVGRLVRRHRHAVVAAGIAATLALASGAALAWWQAQQARQERGRAVALVEFMLGELQDKLTQQGRTELLQSVGERALAYYADEDLGSLDEAALARRAAALRMMGDSARQRQDLGQARAALEQAADTTGRLLALAPDDIKRLQDHATSLERKVPVLTRSEDDTVMLALTREISALRWRAADRAPQDPGLRLQALMGDQWPAAFLVTNPAWAAEGLALLARVQQGLQALPPDLPGLARAQGINLAQTGQALDSLGRYAEAAENLRAFMALQPAEHGAVADVRERSENLVAARQLVSTLLAQGQLGPATVVARQSVARSEADAEMNRDNLALAEQLIQQRTQLAELLRLGGARQQALAQLALIDELLLRVGAVADNNPDWHVHTLGGVLALRAQLHPPAPARPGVPAATAPTEPATDPLLQAFEAHRLLVQRLQAQGWRPPAQPPRVLLALDLLHGDLLAAHGQPEAARLRWEAAVKRALPAAQQGRPLAMQRLAQAWLRLGQPQQARPWVERLQASSWRHPELATLQQALAEAEQAASVARVP